MRSARYRNRLARGAFALISLMMAHAVSATPPSFTGTPITAALPDFDAPVTFNLRQQGVVTGTAPLNFADEVIEFLEDGRVITGVIEAVPVGRVCVTLVNLDFSPTPGATYALRFGMSNSQGSTVVAAITLTNTPGPTLDPQDPSCADPNSAPTASAGGNRAVADTNGVPGELVQLTGTATDAQGDALTFEWFVNGGSSPAATGATASLELPDGSSSVTLRVTDELGASTEDTIVISVAAPEGDAAPIVNAGEPRTIADTDGEPGEMVELNGSATTSAGTIASYEWFLGDSLLGTGASLTAHLPDGVNIVTLRATSTLQLVGSASVQITVGAPAGTVLSELPGLTPNQRRLAAKLDQACQAALASEAPPASELARGGAVIAAKRAPTPEERADFAQKCRGLIFNSTTAQQVDAMDELLGDDFAVARTQTLLFANTQYSSVMDRLIALRGGARGLSLAGLNIMVDGEMVPLAQLQDLAKHLLGGGASSDADLLGDKWGLWLRGNYSFGGKKRDTASPRFDADQYAVMAGVDYRFSANAVAGAALAYGNASVEFEPSSEGGLDTESWAVSLYGSVYAANNLYLDAVVNVADANYDARRNITYVDGFGLVSANARGKTGGLTLSGGVSGGYDFLLGGLTLSPTVGVFYIDAKIDEFVESGAGGLNLIYDEQRFESLTANVGMRATYAWNMSWGVLLPHVRADFVREFQDDIEVFGIRFAADPNAASTPPILVETDNPDTSYWRFAAGLSAQFKHGISGYVEYQRLESFQAISFEDVSLGLRLQRSF